MIMGNEVKTAARDGDGWGEEREREVWLTIYILFRGYQGTWLNPVRLNPLGEPCCQRPSIKPLTGTRSLLFTRLHLYSCKGWVIEEEEWVREKGGLKARPAIRLLFVSRKVLLPAARIAHSTCIDWSHLHVIFMGQYVHKLDSNCRHVTTKPLKTTGKNHV